MDGTAIQLNGHKIENQVSQRNQVQSVVQTITMTAQQA
jgi:hypothetical protein